MNAEREMESYRAVSAIGGATGARRISRAARTAFTSRQSIMSSTVAEHTIEEKEETMEGDKENAEVQQTGGGMSYMFSF